MLKKKICFIFVFFVFIFCFKIASAEVIINEVAWMGTTNSQYEEWLELRNTGSDAVNLNGWKIYKSEERVLFSLSGSISGGSYYLICRTTGSVISPLSGICNEQGPFGGSGLNNSSDSLRLTDESGFEKDSINALGGWPAGDASTKNTMQKVSGGSWVTAVATPGGSNQETSSGSGTEEGEDNTGEESSAYSGSFGSSSNSSSEKSKPKIIPTFKVNILAPTLAFAGQPIEFNLSVKYGDDIYACGKYFWNFGDGDSKKVEGGFEKFTHIFYYPGEYNVSLEYFKKKDARIPDITKEVLIKVVPLTVSITKVGDYKDFFIELTNNANYKIDISNWVLSSGGKTFLIPKNTIISSNKFITIPGRISGFSVGDERDLKLIMSTGEIVFDYNSKSAPVKKLEISEEDYSDSFETDEEYNEEDNESEYLEEEEKTSENLEESNLAGAPILSGQGSLFSKYGFIIGLFAFLCAGGITVYFIRRKSFQARTDRTEIFEAIDE